LMFGQMRSTRSNFIVRRNPGFCFLLMVCGIVLCEIWRSRGNLG
jgi:hypothetical protein